MDKKEYIALLNTYATMVDMVQVNSYNPTEIVQAYAMISESLAVHSETYNIQAVYIEIEEMYKDALTRYHVSNSKKLAIQPMLVFRMFLTLVVELRYTEE